MRSSPRPEAIHVVRPFLPAAAVDEVSRLLGGVALEVRIARPRRSKLGDHRPPARPGAVHRISINENLNPYAFLTTLLHEIAHAATWEKCRHRWRRPRPHGPEWKREFAGLIGPVLAAGAVPDDVADALARSMKNPAAATCSDRGLLLALARHDPQPAGRVRVEELAEREVFRVDGGHVFRAGRRLRTRRQCFDVKSGREWRVHGLLFVERVDGILDRPRPARR
jgi:hypothetical protein